MKIPSQITAGDSISWIDDPTSDNLGNPIDSGLWTLKYAFQQTGTANVSVTSVTEGSGWKTSLTKTQTAAWSPSLPVFWQAYAEKASERVTLASGSVEINPNVSTANTSTELRSQAQQDLDAVQAAMRAMISGGAVAEYTIGNRSLRKISLTDLIIMESKLKAQVASERKAEMIQNGLGNPHNVFVRFGR